MLISTRLTRPLGATALALGLITGTAPASATNGAILAVTATMTPGPAPSGCVPQRLALDGTITVPGRNARVEPVRFEGTSNGCEAADSGTGRFSGGITGPATYVRTGNVIMLYGAEELLTKLKELLGESYPACVFVPTSVYPDVMYMMFCVLAGDDNR